MSYEWQAMMGLCWSISNLLRGQPVPWVPPDDGYDFSDVDIEWATIVHSQESIDRHRGFGLTPAPKLTFSLVNSGNDQTSTIES